MKVSEEFVVGKHNIGWINTIFTNHFKDTEFDMHAAPTFQKLLKSMDDNAIENELKPGMCELGDVLAFLDNAPEECKDGYSNLFYFPSFVVGVFWYAGDRYWSVGAWRRDDGTWSVVERVFSPATGVSSTSNLVPPDTLPLDVQITEVKINGHIFRRVD